MRKFWKILIVVLSFHAAALGFWGCGMAFEAGGASAFRFYTQDGNLFTALVNLAAAVSMIVAMARCRPVPEAIRRLRYYAACCMAITLIVVVFVLGPGPGSAGYEALLLKGSNLPLHLLCPSLTIIALILPDGGGRLPLRCAFTSLLPTLAYGIPVVLLNFMGRMNGPYYFLQLRKFKPHNAVAVIAVLLFGALVIGMFTLLLCNITKRKINRK